MFNTKNECKNMSLKVNKKVNEVIASRGIINTSINSVSLIPSPKVRFQVRNRILVIIDQYKTYVLYQVINT